jgi:hypothetical protein
MKRNIGLLIISTFLFLCVFSCNFLGDISGTAVTLSSISITTRPVKPTYEIGDAIDTTGMVVSATYSDSSTKNVTSSVTTSGFDSSTANASQTITVSYTEGDVTKTAYFTVKIEAVMKYDISYKKAVTWEDSIGTTWVQVIVEIENTGTSPIYLSSGSYDLENSEGTIIASKRYISEYPRVLDIGEKGYLYDETTLDNAVSGIVTVIPRINAVKARIDCTRFPVSEVSLSDTTYFGIKAIGRIGNTTGADEASTIYVVVILYDSSNNPIGILRDLITDDFSAGATMGFEATTLCMPDTITTSSVASYKTYSYPLEYQF